MIINAGERQYEPIEGWGELPEGWAWGQAYGVAVDSEDNVHVFARANHPYLVFDKSGKLIDHWGEGLFTSAHGICITPDDSVFLIENRNHVVFKFDKSGRHCFTLGTRDKPSDTGFTREIHEPEELDLSAPLGGPGSHAEAMPMDNGVAYSGPPFNQPTDASVADNGDIFVSDGYKNARVHKFAPDGTLLKSWGEPGNARELRHTKDKPGCFHTPHGIWVHKDRVYVSDRQNGRIQIFTLDGEYIDIWTSYLRPTKLYVDPKEEVMYISELDDRVSIVDLNGNVIGRIGPGHSIGQIDEGRSHEPGKFWGPHAVWKDSEEAVYVGEGLEGKRVQKFARRK